MRSRIVWVALLVASVVLMGVIQGFSGQDKSSCFGEEKYALKAPEGVESRRGPVNFPHQAHFEFACVKCHHTFDGSEPPMGCMVSGCHDTTEATPFKSGKSCASENTDYFKNAYHQTCWLGCHKEINEIVTKGMAHAPVTKQDCTVCHDPHRSPEPRRRLARHHRNPGRRQSQARPAAEPDHHARPLAGRAERLAGDPP